MDTLRRLFFGATKLGLTLTVVCLLLLTIVWGFLAFQDARTNAANNPLASKKSWPEVLVLRTLNTKVATAWRDGRLYYQVNLTGFSDETHSVSDDASLILTFSDADGFKLWQKQASRTDATRTVDVSNKATGFQWAFDEYQGAEEYRRAASLGISWHGWATNEVTPPLPLSSLTSPARVGGQIKPPRKTRDVRPVYPPIAQSARVQGIVTIDATIGPDGTVKDAKVLSSIPLLDQAALDAVRQWVFTPTLLNGAPVPVIMTVTVQFTLR